MWHHARALRFACLRVDVKALEIYVEVHGSAIVTYKRSDVGVVAEETCSNIPVLFLMTGYI